MNSPVLILGAASDMAIATARTYAAAGYPVQLAARKKERLEELKNDISIRYSVPCTTHELDIAQFDSHATFWHSITEKPGIVISFIGYMNEQDKVAASLNETLLTINANYTGIVSLFNIIEADFCQRRNGVIVGVSSVAGLRGRQSNYIYGSAKAGFTTYLSGLRNKCFHHGVHVMTVLPGFVNTKMTAELALPKLLTAQPADVANAIFKAANKKKNVLYVKWFWKWIMLIVRNIPEGMFKKKKL